MSLDNEFFEEKSRFSIEAFEDWENEEYQPFLSELRKFLWGICFVSIILSILVIPWNESAMGIIMSFFFPCYEGKILEQSFRDDLERGTRLRRFPYWKNMSPGRKRLLKRISILWTLFRQPRPNSNKSLKNKRSPSIITTSLWERSSRFR